MACELDYPRMLNTYRQRELREGIKLRLAPIATPIQDPNDVVEAYRRLITPKTKVILCSHVVFVTGQIMPVRELCRLGVEHGIPVIVDGAHAFAHMAFQRDDLECDYYGTSLHKWLTAAHGTGFLYVRRSRIADLWPLMAAVHPRSDDIRKFEEIGTHPAANRMTIAEALLIYDAIGPQRKEARLRYLRERWTQRIADDPRVSFAARLDPQHTCGFVTFAIEGVEPQALAAHLWNRHRIIVVPIDYGGVKGVRVSPNTYTSIEEIDLFSRAIEDVLAHGLPA
ncbi:MAG: aminotransferase class V-fold PLP-dependent enzyme [Planctomycetota bacterium]|nr:MAG: aminotransferase class V-fold PLP-dependent enzyme [Planctomycetota bacterium]